MLTRRNILIGAAVTGVATLTRSLSSSFAENSPHISPINFKMPAGACDCPRIFSETPGAFRFPSRTYTPEPATVEELRDLHRALHIERVVINPASTVPTMPVC